MPTYVIKISPRELALAESLNSALMESNSMSGYHALQSRSYGKIADALIEVLQTSFRDGFEGVTPSTAEQAEQYARQVALLTYQIIIESGTNVQESIAALIHYWCGDCDEFHMGYCDSRVAQTVSEAAELLNKCEHGFSIHSRCPLGCEEEREAVAFGCGMVKGCQDKLPHEHPEMNRWLTED